jgi:hypothetical protein
VKYTRRPRKTGDVANDDLAAGEFRAHPIALLLLSAIPLPRGERRTVEETTVMTARDKAETFAGRVKAHLVAHAGTPLCVSCIGEALGVTEATARAGSMWTRGFTGITDSEGTCGGCGQRRLVLTAAGVAVTYDGPERHSRLDCTECREQIRLSGDVVLKRGEPYHQACAPKVLHR